MGINKYNGLLNPPKKSKPEEKNFPFKILLWVKNTFTSVHQYTTSSKPIKYKHTYWNLGPNMAFLLSYSFFSSYNFFLVYTPLGTFLFLRCFFLNLVTTFDLIRLKTSHTFTGVYTWSIGEQRCSWPIHAPIHEKDERKKRKKTQSCS